MIRIYIKGIENTNAENISTTAPMRGISPFVSIKSGSISM